MDMMTRSLEQAKKDKKELEVFVGKVSKTVNSELLKVAIIEKSPTEFGMLWADQPMLSFDKEDLSKAVSDEDFEKQLMAFDEADLDKEDGYYSVIGIFRLSTGVPCFQPMTWLIKDGFE